MLPHVMYFSAKKLQKYPKKTSVDCLQKKYLDMIKNKQKGNHKINDITGLLVVA